MKFEKELLSKVHISDKNECLLKALIDDVNEFNKTSEYPIFIDYKDYCDNEEFDDSDTYSIKLDKIYPSQSVLGYYSIIDRLSLKELDCALCALIQYFSEIDNYKKDIVNISSK